MGGNIQAMEKFTTPVT